ncbi:hypothetical protein HAX54_049102 [Datura stramonium]|uniref:Uncharacterized protein n=1 Tax=Datura stramonium TaxID=4076 RepID=A0ABS8SUN1_DATST|nr:hypothetical protein [Datura stramonium]
MWSKFSSNMVHSYYKKPRLCMNAKVILWFVHNRIMSSKNDNVSKLKSIQHFVDLKIGTENGKGSMKKLEKMVPLALATQDFFGIDKDPPLPSDEGLNSKGDNEV